MENENAEYVVTKEEEDEYLDKIKYLGKDMSKTLERYQKELWLKTITWYIIADNIKDKIRDFIEKKASGESQVAPARPLQVSRHAAYSPGSAYYGGKPRGEHVVWGALPYRSGRGDGKYTEGAFPCGRSDSVCAACDGPRPWIYRHQHAQQFP